MAGGTLADAIGGWHEFYAVLATAATTIMASMFVVASIGTSFVTPERASEARVFLTPTVIHLAAVFFVSVLALVPTLDWQALGEMTGIIGLIGLVYSGAVGWNIGRRGRGLDLVDRLWYGFLPVLGYLAILGAALIAFRHGVRTLEMLAAAGAVLLLAGIRNAWDLLIFFVTRSKGPS